MKEMLENNKEFIKWLKKAIENNNYIPILNMDEIYELVETITYWYEFKYSDRYFDNPDLRFLNLKDLSNDFDFNQLKYRLTDSQIKFLLGGYRNLFNHNDKNSEIEYLTQIFLKIVKKIPTTRNEKFIYKSYNIKSSIYINAYEYSGIVRVTKNLKNYINTDFITLENLLDEFNRKYSNILDYSELETTVLFHKLDLKLRDKVLNLIGESILYSKNTTKEKGSKRANLYKEEFQKYIPDANFDLKLQQYEKKLQKSI